MPLGGPIGDVIDLTNGAYVDVVNPMYSFPYYSVMSILFWVYVPKQVSS